MSEYIDKLINNEKVPALECISCWAWSRLPEEFKENKHFGKCECGEIMKLNKVFETRYALGKEVVAKLVRQ